MMVPQEMLALKWNNHPSTFLGILSELLDKASYCDATVACQGRLYSVHRFVLAACSEYFKDIFATLGDRHAVIVLPDVTVEVFTDLLKYMYQGEINIEQDKLARLINAAEYLKIKGLAEPMAEACAEGNDDIIDIDVVSSSSTRGRRTFGERRGGDVRASGAKNKGYPGDKRKFVTSHETSNSGPYKRKRKDPCPVSSKSESYMSDNSSETPEIISDSMKGPVKEMFLRRGVPLPYAKAGLESEPKPEVSSAPGCDMKSIDDRECEDYLADELDVKPEPEEIFVFEDTSSNCEDDGVEATPVPLSAAEGGDGKGRMTPRHLSTPSATRNNHLQANGSQVSFVTAEGEMRDDVYDAAPGGDSDENFKTCVDEVQLSFSPPSSSDAKPSSRNVQQLGQPSMTSSKKSLPTRKLSPADLGKLSSKDFKPILRSSVSTSSIDLKPILGSSGSTSPVDLNPIPGSIVSHSNYTYSTYLSQSSMTSGDQALCVDRQQVGNFPDGVNTKTNTSTTRSGNSPDRGRRSRVPYADRPFPCPHCPYRATINGNLKKHVLKHTGEKPFSCPACDFTTAFHQSLTRHVWSVHPLIQSEQDSAPFEGSDGGSRVENPVPGTDCNTAGSSLAYDHQRRSNSEDHDLNESQGDVSSNYIDANDYLLLEL